MVANKSEYDYEVIEVENKERDFCPDRFPMVRPWNHD